MSGSDWALSAEDKQRFRLQFGQVNPAAGSGGLLTGPQAREFFLQSKLPTNELGKIWELSDLDRDGMINMKEFAIAMFLIRKRLQGAQLPMSLPPSLLQSASTIDQLVTNTSYYAPIGSIPQQPLAAPTSSYGSSFGTAAGGGVTAGSVGITGGGVAGGGGSFGSTGAGPASNEWAIPLHVRQRYEALFRQHDRSNKGFLWGNETKQLFLQTGLHQTTLAIIWSLADVDVDGKLSLDEFHVAMYLIEMAQTGKQLPPTLPANLVPPSFRKTTSADKTDSFGSLIKDMGFGVGAGTAKSNSLAPTAVDGQPRHGSVGSAGGPGSTGTAEDPADLEPPKEFTFEDRRIENFKKGQAELERRRQMLQEQLRQDEEARLRKEKEEQMKRERIRMEQERKRLGEEQRRLDEVRRREREAEEARQLALQQKEEARRELERQRLKEWERNRREQLTIERKREEELLQGIKSQHSDLCTQIEVLEKRKRESRDKIEGVTQKVIEITEDIKGMRGVRDRTQGDIEKNEKEVADLKLSVDQTRREKLALQQRLEQTSFGSPLDKQLSDLERIKRDKQRRINELQAQIEELKLGSSNEAELARLKGQISERRTAVLALINDALAKNIHGKANGTVPTGAPAVASALGSSATDAFDPWGDGEAESGGAANYVNLDDAFGLTSDNSTTNNWQAAFGNNAGDAASSGWGADFAGAQATDNFAAWPVDTAPAGSAQPADNLKSIKPRKSYYLYKACYQFVARQDDELNFDIGDLIWVPHDQSSVDEGWFKGELHVEGQTNGPSGFFPANYVEQIDLTESVGDDQKVPFGSDGFAAFDAFSTSGSAGQAQSTGFKQSSSSSFNIVQQSSTTSSAAALAGNDMFASTTQAKDSFDAFNLVESSSAGPSSLPADDSEAQEPIGSAVAVFSWTAKRDNHLTFDKNDKLTVLRKQDDWWLGRLVDSGKVGWFPKAYVKEVASTDQPTAAVNGTTTLSVSQDGIDQSAAPVPVATAASEEGQPYEALYDFEPHAGDDLSLKAGEKVWVTGQEGEWFHGYNAAGTRGNFPVSYVKQLSNGVAATEESSSKSSMAVQSPISTGNPAISSTLLDIDDDAKRQSSIVEDLVSKMRQSFERSVTPSFGLDDNPPPAVAKVERPVSTGPMDSRMEICKAIASYKATGQGQLDIEPGNIILIKKKSPSGWWEGELQTRGERRRVGWFPGSYVTIVSENDASTPVAPAVAVSSSKDGPIYTALYDYKKQRSDELDLASGQNLIVLQRDDQNWWRGRLVDSGQEGMFPASYVQAAKTG